MARISPQFYWPSLKRDVKEYIQKCVVCQQAKSNNTAPAGLLQPLPIPNQVWEDIAMDFITGLPTSGGFTVIMVVIDRLTKYAHFVPMKADYTSRSVAESFMTNIVKLHGTPKSVVSDRDKIFTSSFWQQLFKLQGTSLAMSTAYHPQSDGQSEALNKCVEMYLRCFTFDNPKGWSKMLAMAEYWYNSAYQNSARMTPFQALYGRPPPGLVRNGNADTGNGEVAAILADRELLLQQLKCNLNKAQQRMKIQADKHRVELQLNVRDLVLVKLQPYHQHSVVLRRNNKLSMRYFGPFKVVERVGAVAYKLRLPETAKIHPVFHISQLKMLKGDNSEPYLPLPLTTTELGPIIGPRQS